MGMNIKATMDLSLDSLDKLTDVFTKWVKESTFFDLMSADEFLAENFDHLTPFQHNQIISFINRWDEVSDLESEKWQEKRQAERREKIKALTTAMANSFIHDRDWLKDAIVFGRVGLNDMTDEDLENECEEWLGDHEEES